MKNVFASTFRAEMKRWLKAAVEFRGIVLMSKRGERYFIVPIDPPKKPTEMWL